MVLSQHNEAKSGKIGHLKHDISKTIADILMKFSGLVKLILINKLKSF